MYILLLFKLHLQSTLCIYYCCIYYIYNKLYVYTTVVYIVFILLFIPCSQSTSLHLINIIFIIYYKQTQLSLERGGGADKLVCYRPKWLTVKIQVNTLYHSTWYTMLHLLSRYTHTCEDV